MGFGLAAAAIIALTGATWGAGAEPPGEPRQEEPEEQPRNRWARWAEKFWEVAAEAQEELEQAAAKMEQEADGAAKSAKKAWADLLAELVGEEAESKQAGLSVACRKDAGGETVCEIGWEELAETDVADAKPSTAARLGERVVVLVHGLDEVGPIWDQLAPALEAAGHTVVRFDYPNDQGVAESGAMLGTALRGLREFGVKRVSIVGHSMGGLVARDVLTREDVYAGDARGHEDLPDVERLIMLGTPNKGAMLAAFQPVMEAREQLLRRRQGTAAPQAGLMSTGTDGRGEAARDLAPGSEFLKKLNARPTPTGVEMTCVVGVATPRATRRMVEDLPTTQIAALVGPDRARRMALAAGELIDEAGDGLVSVESAKLEGVADVVMVEADHRTMVKKWGFQIRAEEKRGKVEPAPAIPVVIERLKKGEGNEEAADQRR